MKGRWKRAVDVLMTIHVCVNVQRHCPVPACICIPSDRERAGSGVGLAVALYGAWVFVKRDFATYMFLQSEFIFLDYEESKIQYYMDYLCLMGLFIFISHYTCKFLRILKKKRRD